MTELQPWSRGAVEWSMSRFEGDAIMSIENIESIESNKSNKSNQSIESIESDPAIASGISAPRLVESDLTTDLT